MNKEKLKFWIPFGGLFLGVPDESKPIDGDFFKYSWMFGVFLAWHCAMIGLFMFLMYKFN